MPDDKTKTGRPDSTRINVHEPYELEYWHKKLDCTPQQLRDAVSTVGPMVDNVRKQLGK